MKQQAILPRNTPLKRTAMKKKRSKPRPGRLRGAAMHALRHEVFLRDGGRCVDCHAGLIEFPESRFLARAYHMSHIVSRARGGRDEASNCVAKCYLCHIVKEHSYGPSGVKPCPAKSSIPEGGCL